jgi:Fe-S cluster assembly ATPase SufC
MLKIENLHARVEDKEILKGLSLEVPAGEVHAIMGPNGAGKSTLSYVLTGRDGYEVTEGSATLDGENLRMEIFQMAVLEPRFLILDETDSGLDIDALRIVSDGVNALRSPERAMLVITHYQRLLDYIKPDRVHVLSAGRIVDSGGPELAMELEREGYDRYARAA